jgi:hypothetical protein
MQKKGPYIEFCNDTFFEVYVFNATSDITSHVSYKKFHKIPPFF